jgi:hypothetical protein
MATSKSITTRPNRRSLKIGWWRNQGRAYTLARWASIVLVQALRRNKSHRLSCRGGQVGKEEERFQRYQWTISLVETSEAWKNLVHVSFLLYSSPPTGSTWKCNGYFQLWELLVKFPCPPIHVRRPQVLIQRINQAIYKKKSCPKRL